MSVVAPVGFYEQLIEVTPEQERLVTEWVTEKVPESERAELLAMLGLGDAPPQAKPSTAPTKALSDRVMCRRGRHLSVPTNTFTTKTGATRCRLCKRETDNAYRARLNGRRPE